MKTFHHILLNTLFTAVAGMFVWFAIVFWIYLETKSVISTAFAGGGFMIAMSLSSFWFGSIVDHHRKKMVMILSSAMTCCLLAIALWIYRISPSSAFESVSSPRLWIFVVTCLFAIIAGNLRNIAMPTLVTLLVPPDARDKANGMVGMIMGLSSMGAGFASGFTLAYLGMGWVLGIGITVSLLAIIHLVFLKVAEAKIIHTEEKPKHLDVKGTFRIIKNIPGLWALIFFTTFNNLLGGAFMALMDAYGLSLMSVQAWGTLWGVLSSGFIIGGLYIAKYGLGDNPLRNLFRINIITWFVAAMFTIQPSIILLSVGILIWVCLMPFIEATEHTIIQKVVPFERQGRVIGVAQSIETAASPVTSFIIGPLAQFLFIPFMTTGAGVNLIGSWFGTGPGRGIALVFVVTGIIGLLVTLIAMHSRSYKLLAEQYVK